jgi:hypothetical protein
MLVKEIINIYAGKIMQCFDHVTFLQKGKDLIQQSNRYPHNYNRNFIFYYYGSTALYFERVKTVLTLDRAATAIDKSYLTHGKKVGR